jgi:hypothetical protein
MSWWCERDCGFGGKKRYGSAEDASRYALALDREDRNDLGLRAPLSMILLRFARRRRITHP